MKQKFHIQKSLQKKELIIQEYAVIQSDLRKRANPMLQEEDFSLLCEQTYDIRNLKSAIAVGKTALISELRTKSFFPNGIYIDKIANKVVELFGGKGDQSAVLIFDDREYFLISQEKADINELEDEEAFEDDEKIDDILEENENIDPEPTSDYQKKK